MTQTSRADAFRRQLEAISAEYRCTLPEVFARIDARWRKLADGPALPADLDELQRELHTLAGSAKTLGVGGVSEAAAAAAAFLEPFCARHRVPKSTERAEFERLLAALATSPSAM